MKKRKKQRRISQIKKAPSENKQVSYNPSLAAALALLHKRRGKMQGWRVFLLTYF